MSFQKEMNELVATVIGLVSSASSIALRIADRKDDEDMYLEEA